MASKEEEIDGREVDPDGEKESEPIADNKVEDSDGEKESQATADKKEGDLGGEKDSGTTDDKKEGDSIEEKEAPVNSGTESAEGAQKWYVDSKTKQLIFGTPPAPEPEEESTGQGLYLFECMRQELGLKPAPKKVLDTLDLDGVVSYIKSGKCKNIITMAGAGISTSAGIPDFRTPGTGLYDNLQKYDLPNPQAIFDIDYFKTNPEPFFYLAKELWPGIYKPTLCHYFIKMLHEKGLLLRHFTQNIDTLEAQSGLDPDKLVEAHGSFNTAHCIVCNKEYTKDFIQDKVLAGEVPKCTIPECEDGVIKPDIVFFGESLPERFVERVLEDFEKCDLLIILGTSLVVQPFASLTHRVPESTPRLSINLEKTGAGRSNPISILMFGGGFLFDEEDNYRDIFWKGTCDDGCLTLAEKLGWKRELLRVVKREHAKFDKQNHILKSKIKSSVKKPTVKSNTETSAPKEKKPDLTDPENCDNIINGKIYPTMFN